MTDKDSSDEVTGEATSAFPRAEFLNEPDALPTVGRDSTVSGVDKLPTGSALLIVKRGPNAGSRFLLDQPVTSAGRHPGSDIFLDDVTVSRRHAEFRGRTTNSRLWTLVASTAPTSTGRRWSRRCCSTATRCRSASSAWCSRPSARTTAATGNRGAGDRTRCPQLRCGRVSFAGRRFNVAHRILLTGIASQAAACKQSLRILLLVNRTYSTRALNADGERGQVIAAGVGGCCSASARRAAR